MSKTRKLLSVVLALVMVFSLATVAFAVDYEETEDNTQTWTLGDAVANGSDWDVPVSLKTNYATGAIQFDLVLTGDLAVKTNGVAIGADYPYDADIQVSTTSKRVVIVPDTDGLTGAETASEAKAIDGVIATVTLTGTEGTVTINNDPKTATKPEGTLIALRLDEANIVTGDLIAGQKVTADPNTITIGAKPADLECTATGTSQGVIIDKNKTFGGTYAGVVYGFTRLATNTFFTFGYITNTLQATNEGSISTTVTRTVGTNGFGTGTVISVLNKDGTLSKKYIICIFGDVDGNGLINTQDQNKLKGWIASPTTMPAKNTIISMAAQAQSIANVTMLTTINAADYTALKNFISNNNAASMTVLNKLNPADLALKHNAQTGLNATTYYG